MIRIYGPLPPPFGGISNHIHRMGWFLDEALNRVHLSNMSKLDEDGKPIYRDDGKVLKGPN